MAEPGGAAAPPAAAAKPDVPPSQNTPTSRNPAIPVGLNEAALDSPSFRCAAVHFADQIELVERWLEGYVRSSTKVSHDLLAIEETINAFLRQTIPTGVDGLIDPDYTLLALKRVGDTQKDWWASILGVMRRMDGLSAEPIRGFLQGELRTFKETRKTLDAVQRTFDTTVARYVAQSKTKEPSSLREDAFALYETRKAYLKASMDYCQLAPQVRFTLDKLLVRVASDVWKEMRRWRDVSAGSNRFADEMDRIRGWSKEMEASEAVFKRELQAARRDVGENAVATFKPSRELEDYSSSTVAFLGSRGPVNVQPKDDQAVISEKQGWLFLKNISGKPARTTWIRRWYYCRNGIFGWLVQGPHGVLQGDEIGVLLCNTRPAVGEERRFCFEIKTKSQNIMLQSETQGELQEWLEVFEVAKKQAFDATAGRETKALPGGVDPAFAITPPTIPEFSAKTLEGLEDGATLDRSGTLPVPGTDAGRASFDVGGVGSAPRRSVTGLARDIARDLPREEGESGREHAARIMQRLELHRRQAFGGGGDAGIAGLISSSSNLLPGYAAYNASVTNLVQQTSSPRLQPINVGGHSSLAPPTLAKAPTSTFLTRVAVSASAERAASGDGIISLPTAVVANYWGTIPWSALYSPREDDMKLLRLDDDPLVSAQTQIVPASGDSVVARKALSGVGNTGPEVRVPDKASGESFPLRYPNELKAHHPQFRLLFPNVPLEEKLVMVFNAAWTSTAADGSNASKGMMGNGRIYVTSDDMYFYGHQMGLVVAYAVSLDIISEVTAAPGKDCDFIYLHLSQNMNKTGLTRIIVKTFLLDLNLLHSRLNLLVDDLQSEEPMNTSEIITALIKLETDQYDRKSPGAESWEEVAANTPIDDGTASGRPVFRNTYNARDRSARPVRKPVPKFQLPAHPVVYEPEDMGEAIEERTFELSAKGCFHVLFGDKSFIFPKLYFERRAKEIAQGPWQLMDHGKMSREFKFKVDTLGLIAYAKKGAEKDVVDQQVIDVFSDHFTYVVTYIKTPWHLPNSSSFKLITKVVITHVAKSKCKLALYTKVEWSKKPPLSKALVQRQALEDAHRDAEELADVATDQVRKLGPHSRTKRAIQVYGSIGQQTQVVIFTPGETQADGTAAVPGKKSQKMIRPRTLTDMLLETLRSIFESVATSLLMGAFAGVRKIFSVVTAHRMILVALTVSLLANAVFTSREGSSWWTERAAAKFMGRMGVGPNTMMSKAVYLTDLDDAALRSVVVAPDGGSEW